MFVQGPDRQSGGMSSAGEGALPMDGAEPRDASTPRDRGGPRRPWGTALALIAAFFQVRELKE
jgi:hypothetical protein